MARKYKYYLIGLIILGIAAYLYSDLATEKSADHLLKKYSQLPKDYLSTNKQFTKEEQNKLTSKFLSNYFSKWHQIPTPEEIAHEKNGIERVLNSVKKIPSVGSTNHPYDQTWINTIENNMDLAHFPNDHQNAISIQEAHVRSLPTLEPAFTRFQSLSKGYPFDNFQESYIPAGVPLKILHKSKDNAWYYVLIPSFSGWIENKEVAFVNGSFISAWENGHYAVSLKDNLPLFDGIKFQQKSRIGVLYPIKNRTLTTITLGIPSPTGTENAKIKLITVNNEFFKIFPLPLDTKTIANLATEFIGRPYGWGGMYAYRDCSSTTRDLMSLVGIWLPRNSSAQMKEGRVISLKNLSNHEKEKIIREKGVPWLTIIHLPGHVVLYVGEKNGRIMVLQDMWGLHIYPIFGNDRIIIGKTVITPLDFGHQFWNVSQNGLTVTEAMTILG